MDTFSVVWFAGLLTVAGVVVLVLFLVFREFWTWYWKQSEQVQLLEEILETLQQQQTQAQRPEPQKAPAATAPTSVPAPAP